MKQLFLEFKPILFSVFVKSWKKRISFSSGIQDRRRERKTAVCSNSSISFVVSFSWRTLTSWSGGSASRRPALRSSISCQTWRWEGDVFTQSVKGHWKVFFLLAGSSRARGTWAETIPRREKEKKCFIQTSRSVGARQSHVTVLLSFILDVTCDACKKVENTTGAACYHFSRLYFLASRAFCSLSPTAQTRGDKQSDALKLKLRCTNHVTCLNLHNPLYYTPPPPHSDSLFNLQRIPIPLFARKCLCCPASVSLPEDWAPASTWRLLQGVWYIS